MQCPLCKVECRVAKSYYRVRNDKTADKDTELYICHDMVCRNKACSNYDQVVETVENRVELTDEDDTE